MENSVKAIIIGASIAITMVIVSVGFFVLRQGQDAAKTTSNKIADMNAEIAETEYTMYDEVEFSGSEVVNVLRRHKGEYVGIEVITGKDTKGSWYNYNVSITSNVATIGQVSSEKISETIDATDIEYINPNGRFKGVVYRDENGTIAAIVFKQVF